MVMINEILLSIRDRVEDVLQSNSARDQEWTVLANPAASDSISSDHTTDKVVMAVASIQSDALLNAYRPGRAATGDNYPVTTAPLFLDIYIAFISYLAGKNYTTGIGLLSRIVGYFQENPVLEEAAAPEIADVMGRLAIEFVSLDFAQSAHLTTLLNLKGAPFIVYRLRRLPFDGPAIKGVVPAVRRTPAPWLKAGGRGPA